MDYPNFRLDGQTAMVSGASKGLGRGIAAAMADAGAGIAAVARSESELASLVGEIEAAGSTARPYVCDIADIATVPDGWTAQ